MTEPNLDPHYHETRAAHLLTLTTCRTTESDTHNLAWPGPFVSAAALAHATLALSLRTQHPDFLDATKKDDPR